jgi:rubrerythrin
LQKTDGHEGRFAMFEQIDVQDAIKRSIQTEKNARDFYRLGASHMKDGRARRVFELLASEEAEHARMFYDVYLGKDIPPFDALMAVDPSRDTDWLSDLEQELMEELDERRAMELAMDKELKLEQALRELAGKIPDERVREVFLWNARSTRQHYELIESEYAFLMGMVHETDIDTFVRE